MTRAGHMPLGGFPQPGAPYVRAGAPHRNGALTRLAVDSAWVIFLFFASYAGFGLAFKGTERLVWFPLDVAVLLLLLFRRDDIINLMRKNSIYVGWAALACASSVWSLAPSMSLYHGLQLFFTIMGGLVLINYSGLQRTQQSLFIALLIAAVLSFVFVLIDPYVSRGEDGAWRGLFPHKNVFGGVMSLLIVTGLSLFLQRWRPVLTLTGVLFAVFLLFNTRAGTAIITLTIALSILPFAVFYRRGWGIFVLYFGTLLIFGSMLLFIFEEAQFDLIRSTLESLGKDETLTGRTLLWDIGMQAFESRPWLGYGFKGYWEGAGTTANYLRYVSRQELWFFHNNFIEVAVAFGVMGPIVLVYGLLLGWYRALKRFAAEPEYVNLWPILIIAITSVYCTVENPLFTNHGFSQFLFIAAVGNAVSFVDRRSARDRQ